VFWCRKNGGETETEFDFPHALMMTTTLLMTMMMIDHATLFPNERI